MADNTTLDAGAGGDTIATDDIAGVKFQRVKIALGGDGTNDGDVASGNPMPVTHGALTELAAAIDTEVQCDIVGALPAGTNAIGKLAANTGVDIGDVDVTSVVPGTGATNLGKAEDAIHSSGDVGVMVLGVRQDSQVDFGADGDYVPLSIDADGAVRVSGAGGGTQYTEDAPAVSDPIGTALIMVRSDSLLAQTSANGDNIAARGTDKGELYVKHADAIPVTDNSGSLTVDNAGTFAVQVDGAALTALQLIDDAVHADDAAFTLGTSKGVMAMGFAGIQSVNANDAAALACETDGSLHIHDGGNSITVDGTVTANAGTNLNTSALALEAGGNLAGAATSLAVLDDWDETDRAKVNIIVGQAGVTAGAGNVAANTPRVTLAADDPAVASLSVLDDWDNAASDGCSVSGDVAHDTSDVGEPLKLGGRAIASLRTATLVSGGDRTNLHADLDGVQVVKLNTTGGDLKFESVSNTDGAATASATFSSVASSFHYITSVSVFRSDAGTSLAFVDFRSGVAGTVIWRMPLPPNGGSVMACSTPIFKTLAAGDSLAYDVSAALTTVYISLSGFTSKV